MKASLKLREEQQAPLLRFKVPVTVGGLPFVSGLTAGDPSDLRFHLRSASSAGPSFKLSYSPNRPFSPFSFSVSSGAGALGCPHRSPFVLSAHFSLFGPLNPSFSLQVSPHLGDFSLKKIAHSLPNPNPNPIVKENGSVVDLETPASADDLRAWPDLRQVGSGLTATTLLPVARQVEVRLRWGVNFPAEISRRNLPFLAVDKIGIERIEPVKAKTEEGPKAAGTEMSDVEVLRGMCFWMGREVEALQRENRDVKERLEELRSGIRGVRSWQDEEGSISIKRLPTAAEGDLNNFEQWRKKKQSEEGGDGRRDVRTGGGGSNVEEELKRAIKASSSSS